jgi:hypothetical protein
MSVKTSHTGDQILELRAPGVELRPDGLGQVILVVVHAVTLDAGGLGGAEHLLGVLRGADFVDAGGHDGDAETALLEGFGQLGKVFLDAIRLHMTAGPDGGLDALHAHVRGDVGDLVEAQSVEVFREEAILTGPARRCGGRSAGERGDE